MQVKNNVSPGRSGTVVATGTPAEVAAWKAQFFNNYHPCGYGTVERSRVTNADGTVTVTVWRSHSCG